MITLDQYIGQHGTDHADELTNQIVENAKDLLDKVNKLLAMHEGEEVLRSGWRPQSVNEKVGGSKNSKHLTGNAVDVADPRGDLGRWCLENEKYLQDFQLWMEHPNYTKTWCHFQRIPPNSGKRYYVP